MVGTKPQVLVLGGLGFIGRHLVKYLVDEKLCSRIRVADKLMPALAYLSPEFKAIMENKIVETVQVDLTRDAHVEKAFKLEDGTEFDYVINLCGETRFGISEKDYENRIVTSARKCALMAARHYCKKFIEISSARVYKSDKKAADELASIEPWTLPSKYRYEAESQVKKTEGLNYVILRPALVYGKGDMTSLTPRLTVAAVYKYLDEKMKLLWCKDLRINCVHIDDVVHAIWVACTQIRHGSTLNLADSSDLDQGKLNEMIQKIFGIKTGFLGSIISNMARLNFDSVVETSNDKHVPAWQRLCMQYSINNTPVTPFIDGALLRSNHLSINGQMITRVSDFRYKYPLMTPALLKEQLCDFISHGLFPAIL